MSRFKLLFALAVIMAGSNVPAQAVLATQTSLSSNARTVTLDLQGVALRKVLDEISRQSGQPIGISVDADNTPTKINIVVRNVSALDAVRAAVRGTGFKTQTNNSGKIMVVRANPSNQGAQGIIAGKVTDAKTGRGVSGANVSLDNDPHGTVTSQDGAYRLAGVSAGTHAVSVRLVGYARQTRSVTLGEDVTVAVDFKLEPSASVLDQVVVTGTVVQTELKAVPNAITVVTAKQIEERGITRIDQLFRGDIPGLFALNLGSGGGTGNGSPLDQVVMFSRGATTLQSLSANEFVNSSPIKTYVDGVELTDPKYMNHIDPKSIERIEILTGPQASTIYGSNAINGVMQIFTKRGLTNRPSITASLASGVLQNDFSSALAPQHEYSAQVSGSESRWSYTAGGNWSHVGAWTPAKRSTRLGGFGSARFQGGPVTADASARINTMQNHQYGDMSQVDAEYRAIGWYVRGSSLGLSPLTTAVFAGQTLGLTVAYAPTSWWSNELVVGTDDGDTEYRSSPPAFTSTSDTSLTLAQTTSTRTSIRYSTTGRIPVASHAQLVLVAGGDGWHSLATSLDASPSNLTGTINSSSWFVTRNPSHNTGGFVQGQLGLWDALFFTYGLRAEWNPNYGEEAQPNLAPKYGVAYTRDILTPWGSVTSKLRGSYGRSTRPPLTGQKSDVANRNSSLFPLYGVFNNQLANPDLNPEFQQGGEGGLELYMGNRASLVVTRYNQTVDNLIARVGAIDSVRSLQPLPPGSTTAVYTSIDPDGYGYTPQNQYLNVASIRNQGWELQGSINTGPLTTRGTYSWTKSRVIGITEKYRAKIAGTQYTRGSVFQYLPEHTWAINMTYTNKATTVSMNVNGIGMLYNGGDELYYRSFSNAIRLNSNKLRMSASSYTYTGRGYATADANISHQLSRALQGILQVRNLTNYYRSDRQAGFASLGRQTKVGVNIRL